MTEKIEISKMTNEEMDRIAPRTIYDGLKNGDISYSDFVAWFNTCNHISYSIGYSDGRD